MFVVHFICVVRYPNLAGRDPDKCAPDSLQNLLTKVQEKSKCNSPWHTSRGHRRASLDVVLGVAVEVMEVERVEDEVAVSVALRVVVTERVMVALRVRVGVRDWDRVGVYVGMNVCVSGEKRVAPAAGMEAQNGRKSATSEKPPPLPRFFWTPNRRTLLGGPLKRSGCLRAFPKKTFGALHQNPHPGLRGPWGSGPDPPPPGGL